MLRQLSIRAFALIDEVDLDLGPGLTVLVGETGAGKSIIIDALSSALGARMPSDSVRKGARKCVIEATFDATGYPAVTRLLKENELDWDAADLIVRRELTASGTSRCFVNDTPTTAAVVRDIAAYLMDFHGQHDTHGLLSASRHREIIDAFAGVTKELGQMRDAWQSLREAEAALEELKEKARTSDEERVRLEFVLKEIQEVDPQPGEDEELAIELRKSESREQIVAAANEARSGLYLDETSAFERLQKAISQIKELLPFAPELDATLADLESAVTACKEGAAALSEYADVEDFDPDELEECASVKSFFSDSSRNTAHWKRPSAFAQTARHSSSNWKISVRS